MQCSAVPAAAVASFIAQDNSEADDAGSCSSISGSGKGFICMSGLGRWGQLGNQIMQYIFLKVYCSVHGLQALTPSTWSEGREWFSLNDGCCDDKHSELPLVADRIVLQHAPWLRWARGREPLRTLEGDGRPLSKKQLLLLFPQVSSRSLLPAASPPFHNVDLHGWFQFHTCCYAPHKSLIRALFRPSLTLRPALEVIDTELILNMST
jgi:hypothetical protein